MKWQGKTDTLMYIYVQVYTHWSLYLETPVQYDLNIPWTMVKSIINKLKKMWHMHVSA